MSCKQPFGGPNFFAVETPVVLIVHRAGAAARLRPVARCLERGEEINNQWLEERQQLQPLWCQLKALNTAFNIDTSICNKFNAPTCYTYN